MERPLTCASSTTAVATLRDTSRMRAGLGTTDSAATSSASRALATASAATMKSFSGMDDAWRGAGAWTGRGVGRGGVTRGMVGRRASQLMAPKDMPGKMKKLFTWPGSRSLPRTCRGRRAPGVKAGKTCKWAPTLCIQWPRLLRREARARAVDHLAARVHVRLVRGALRLRLRVGQREDDRPAAHGGCVSRGSGGGREGGSSYRLRPARQEGRAGRGRGEGAASSSDRAGKAWEARAWPPSPSGRAPSPRWRPCRSSRARGRRPR